MLVFKRAQLARRRYQSGGRRSVQCARQLGEELRDCLVGYAELARGYASILPAHRRYDEVRQMLEAADVLARTVSERIAQELVSAAERFEHAEFTARGGGR